MIEYDKANVTSSYPSLTEYEVATVLDKAYNALIAQKVTGNNIRRSVFEADTKSISDLQQLVINHEYYEGDIENNCNDESSTDFDNNMKVALPANFLYYVGCQIQKELDVYESGEYIGPIDQKETDATIRTRRLNVKLINHDAADKFKASAYNIPWIKNPVCYIENDTLYIVFDSYDKPNCKFVNLTYIKTPNKFVKNLDNLGDFLEDDDAASQIDNISYFDWSLIGPTSDIYNAEYNADANEELTSLYSFECNDTMAEELISLAVSFALENVESQRLNSKLNMRGLEA